MPNHEDGASNAGYDTPLPELDGHRHQIPAFQRPDCLHTHRSILDSLYGTRLDTDLANPSGPRTPDGEDAVDEDGHGASPGPPHSRRPAATFERRSISPPNAVTAFAEARRRGRDDIARTVSVASRRAHHDSASLATNGSPEEDVCYPVLGTHREGDLYIDFDFLETLIEPETRQEAAVCVLPSLLPASTVPNPLAEATSDGEFIKNQPNQASLLNGKVADQNIATTPQQHADPKRFSFFSSAWESTSHATEFGGLILPGDYPGPF
ncbi:hypothetical protein FOMG_18399 [Fusarium oxysporum f. sp. melonis 26406]|uniref:Uncharacterized protein n=1 Tax=Fusarium oxysporum f. sp. melonis 26406 TaxID=1089452 RepID=W9YZD6_FUSOX|nr:hypothetical protein FOMG_18399 [Fusarium oxysporum f. sp. melonis 26406]